MSPVTPAADNIDQELLLFFARQGRRMPVPVFVAAMMLAMLVHGHVADSWVVAWVGVVCLMLLVRRIVLGRLPAQHGLSGKRRLQIAIILSGLNGLSHALSLLFFTSLPELERVILTLLLVGLCTGAIATTAGYRPVFVAYILPIFAPLVLLWAGGQRAGYLDWTPGAAALILVVLATLLTAIAGDSYRLFRESFEIRLQQVRLNRELTDALARAEQANQAKTRFLASASHDLRQPIHTLSLFAAALAMRPLDESSREITGHIQTALGSLTAQLDALLDVSKLDAGVVQASVVPVRLPALLHRVHGEFAPIAQSRGLALLLHCEGEAMADTDPVLLGRVLCNLVDNAIKYTPEGSVQLELLVQGGLAVIIVQDSGCGIPADEQGRVFEEFYQLDNPERDRANGLGLGLSIVARLARLLALRLEMVSREGVGTAFYLVLPLAQAAPAPAVAESAAAGSLAGRQVLVVDDELAVRSGMQALLLELGARVSLADGTAQAAALAALERPDLALVDFRLRGQDSGLLAVQALRELYPGLPVILVSGDTAPNRLREARSAGLPLLHKPVPLAALLAAVAQLDQLPKGVHHGYTQ